MNCKNVLIITYYYPPAVNGAVQRMAKFVKYLPDFNYKPFVITSQNSETIDNNNNKLDENIYKITDYTRRFTAITNHSPAVINTRAGARPALTNIMRFLNQTARWLTDKILIPDAQILWTIAVFLKSLKIIQKHKIEIILTTSPPVSVHIAGLLLKKFKHIRWVSDFRDGWIFDTLKPSLKHKSARFFIEQLCEKIVVNNTDILITVTDRLVNDFKKRYGEFKNNKINLITNGFDSEDYKNLLPPESKEWQEAISCFKIVHTGTLSKSRPYEGSLITPFLEGMKLALNNEPILTQNLKVFLIGDISYKEKEEILSLNLEHSVKVLSAIPYAEALSYQLYSDALLLITPVNKPSVATTKIFEYLAVKKPILALAENNFAEHITKHINAGITVPPNVIEAISSGILSIFHLHKKWEFSKNFKSEIAKFERRNLTKQLAEYFDKITR